MSFSVATLAAYVKDNSDILLTKTVLSPKTAKLIEAGGTVLTGVKSSERIGIFDTDAVFQAGACGFTPSGTTAITQRSVTVGDIKIEESLCYKTLEAKYTQKMLTAGVLYDNPTDFNFYQLWVDLKIAAASRALDVAIWQGDTGSGTANLNKFDGFIKQIVAASDELDANATPYIATPITAVAGITSSNVIAALQAVVKRTATEVKQSADFRVFIGYDVLESYTLALQAANLYHYKPENSEEITIVGTNVKAVAVAGLSAATGMFGMRLSNMVVGTDLLSDQTQVEVWYDKADQAVNYRNAFKYGVGIAFTNEVTKFIPTP